MHSWLKRSLLPVLLQPVFDGSVIFFPSGVADHALRLGPYMRRSCYQENFNMDTGGRMKHGKS